MPLFVSAESAAILNNNNNNNNPITTAATLHIWTLNAAILHSEYSVGSNWNL